MLFVVMIPKPLGRGQPQLSLYKICSFVVSLAHGSHDYMVRRFAVNK